MLIWTEEYATGLPAIDHQHRRLFEFLNRLEASVEQDGDAKLLDADLDFLRTYVEVHFASEELCMFRNVCSRAGQNRDAHQAFLRKLTELTARPEKQAAARSIVSFLNRWISGHILGIDTSLSACIDENGVEWQGPPM